MKTHFKFLSAAYSPENTVLLCFGIVLLQIAIVWVFEIASISPCLPHLEQQRKKEICLIDVSKCMCRLYADIKIFPLIETLKMGLCVGDYVRLFAGQLACCPRRAAALSSGQE